MTVLPADLLVSPVKGHDDLVQFQFDFTLQGKALEDQTVTEEDNGDLIIEGYAAVFEGDDRQGENFTDGAFQRGTKAFLNGQAALCYHHKHDKLLGRVLELQEEQGKGLKMKARVDGAIKNHPELGTLYQQIKNGSLNALSVGGYFKRALVAGKQKITDMDFTEISVTPVPVHPGTNFAVIAGKALEDMTPETVVEVKEVPQELVERLTAVTRVFDGLGTKALPEDYDPQLASTLGELLTAVQVLRQHVSATAAYESDDRIKEHADAIETSLVAHEAELHKLAADIGPLPPSFKYL